MTELTQSEISEFIDRAFAEDIGTGDITSDNVVPEEARLRVALETRESIVVAGLDIALECFRKMVPDAKIDKKCNDGDTLNPKSILAVIEGPARGILTAERTALNTLQHLSGIATTTCAYVQAMGKTSAKLLDTRKTLPGWRKMEKYATRMGGAQNHRMGLYDGVMIKDNHIGVVGSITKCVEMAKAANLPKIEVECDTIAQVREAVEAGADIILLDNMGPDMLREAVAIVDGRCKTEASGGVRLDTIADIAATGVDYVSVGRITQSAPAVDIGLDVAIL
ncbi:carboxylating nicotinate-nucleotide diphosphorylase [Thalassospira marina]|uniref:Probable nicotinate-nucleotide pyrophosphorylase [carboxylating] n=1 Tax=Thalassospira marina TaxID=2048283 RepID=A0A2N3KJ57_9PROT|nr:carboxylating nicotinate-nucleotide diphosphorylase [Thalassospira marina]AUG51558.1 nicotinate-nucleotide diphosphorylase (carboxylating) [Thalassospira marina]PKR50536.1 nicotinate-nucleotide diphosphorylase (carboxylating) [Thalassospira marina]